MNLYRKFIQDGKKPLEVNIFNFETLEIGITNLGDISKHPSLVNPAELICRLGANITNLIPGTTYTSVMEIISAPVGALGDSIESLDLLTSPRLYGGARLFSDIESLALGPHEYVIRLTITDSINRVATNDITVEFNLVSDAGKDLDFKIILEGADEMDPELTESHALVKIINMPVNSTISNLRFTLTIVMAGDVVNHAAEIKLTGGAMNSAVIPGTNVVQLTGAVTRRLMLGEFKLTRDAGGTVPSTVRLTARVLGPAVPTLDFGTSTIINNVN
jgi:hypothetical protein